MLHKEQDKGLTWCFAASLILTFLFVFSCSSFQIKDESNKDYSIEEFLDIISKLKLIR